jgi:hypothetical protein
MLFCCFVTASYHIVQIYDPFQLDKCLQSTTFRLYKYAKKKYERLVIRIYSFSSNGHCKLICSASTNVVIVATFPR